MNIILATGHPQSVMDALITSSRYVHLGVAALLGGAAYVLRELERRNEGDSMALELVVFILALAALLLDYQGIFGDS